MRRKAGHTGDSQYLGLDPEIRRAGRAAWTLGEVSVLNPFFSGKPSLLVRPSADWMGPTHMMEGDLF